jgi:hypothetical protein
MLLLIVITTSRFQLFFEQSVGANIDDKALHSAGICRHTKYLNYGFKLDCMFILASIAYERGSQRIAYRKSCTSA